MTNRCPHPYLSILLIGLVSLVAGSLAFAEPIANRQGTASEEAQDPASAFGELMEVEVVNVEVYVTDKKGEPVLDLTAEDFEVFEDGNPVAVTNFRRIDRRNQPLRRPAQPTPPPRTEAAEAAEPAPSPPPIDPIVERDPFHLVLYVDHAFLRSTNRHRVLRDLRQLVHRVDPGTRILVASHARSLKIDQPFTTDATKVTDALNAMELKTAFGNDGQNQFLDLLRDIEDTRVPLYRVEAKVRSYAQELQQNVENGLESLTTLINSMAGLPGDKALVYAADGLPLTPAESLFNAISIRSSDVSILSNLMTFNASRDFQVLAQHANTADVTFYSIHAAGLEAPLGASAEISGSGIDELRPTVDSVRTANFQGSGRLLADATGGIAMLNTNNFSAGLGQMLQDFSTFYSLGYQPPHGRDERYHKIEVKLKRKDLTVRHRRGYRDRSLSNRLKDSVASALQHGLEENPFGLTVRAGQTRANEESRRVKSLIQSFTVGIPMKSLVFVPNESSHEARTKIYLSVLDSKGQASPVQEIPLPMSITNESIERALQTSWNQEVELLVRTGSGLIAVGVWDEIGRSWSIVRRSFVASN